MKLTKEKSELLAITKNKIDNALKDLYDLEYIFNDTPKLQNHICNCISKLTDGRNQLSNIK